ncbi:hypothetical protein GUITHDRAFT_117573 [Guillardia theta CCMP2712]|uniref:Uncharacterized protein n=1 Tax=Guillardia theta (strain CCMP2712) TaxID=905079 RepID=L1IJC9_GUITC|nr:hypothetical protein GUITHDRAFT_117573 [Guillardia theta CCMP2712]EKX36217.1 hypothetical protein GUITHDRAFT_117573 [Guillardia theta CCMP2712]|eukprot:XP_005823197.1 hypothetical protein GUITHDRAFT_117573 [Guillardia theta CCMP2712]
MRERRPDTSSKEPEHKPLPRKQRAREDVLRDKQILIAVALPLVSVLPAHPQDGRDDDEGRDHAVLSTWLKVQQSLLKAVKPRKGWEMVEMSEWRDAVPQGVVWLPLDQIDRVRPDAYEKMYREYLESLINSTTNHRQLLFGHVFFEPRALEGKGQEAGDGRPSEQSSRKKVVFATVLRHPILRLASQYDFDRVQAKSKVYQTRYFCGFSGDCKSDESGGPTEQMVKRARENMMRSFKFIGILEDWNSTVRVLEAVLPTLAEGISDASRGGDEKHCAKRSLVWTFPDELSGCEEQKR